jgi:hypothetical protein
MLESTLTRSSGWGPAPLVFRARPSVGHERDRALTTLQNPLPLLDGTRAPHVIEVLADDRRRARRRVTRRPGPAISAQTHASIVFGPDAFPRGRVQLLLVAPPVLGRVGDCRASSSTSISQSDPWNSTKESRALSARSGSTVSESSAVCRSSTSRRAAAHALLGESGTSPRGSPLSAKEGTLGLSEGAQHVLATVVR